MTRFNEWPDKNLEDKSSTKYSFRGRWSDGKTAASHDVDIDLQSRHLVFKQDGGSLHSWTYQNIHSPQAVKKTDDHALLTSTDAEGERLYIDETGFAPRILELAPNISAKSHQWALLKWPLGIAASLVLFWTLTFFDIISPATYIAHFIPDNSRVSLGKAVISTIKKDRKFCTNSDGLDAFGKIISRLHPAIPSHVKYNIKVADLSFVNAFAAPGDQIIVSGKLIEAADSPDEVAGVIAHELGHAIELHPEANIVRVLGILTVMQLLAAGDPGTIGNIALLLVQSGYSRTAEAQADVHAATIMKEVNIDTRPMAGFFEKLIKKHEEEKEKKDKEKKEKAEQNKNAQATTSDKKHQSTKNKKSYLDWISTHPPTKKRIDYFNRLSITTTPPIMTDTEWQALKNICKGADENSEKRDDGEPGDNKNHKDSGSSEGDAI